MTKFVAKIAIFTLFYITTLVSAESFILEPPAEAAKGKPIAIIWIHGMQCKPEAYKTIAQQFQAVAAQNGYKAWVGAPEFAFDVPEPVLIDHYVSSTLSDMKSKHGFTGDKYYLAAHSLGGVMSQIYAKGKSSQIKGLILMGSVLLRNTRKIQSTGHTLFDYDVPTLTLNGELDGLLRISRGAESYWHQMVNIDQSQANKYPVVALQGVSHSSFMDSTMLPSAVVSGDIKPELEEKTAHETISKAILSFVAQQEGDEKTVKLGADLAKYSDDFMKPLIEAMTMEGSYQMKDPCYDNTLVNRDSPVCLQGSPWSEQAQKIMAGELSDKNVDITTQDNFHRVYTVTPVHLPQVNNSCPAESESGDAACMLQSISVTENFYNRIDSFDTGKFEIGAVEMKAKLMSRQSVQVKAGDKDSDFHQDDEVGNRCADINQKALDWALSRANKNAMERYNKFGKKLVIGDDLGPFNAGPLWIWKYMQYNDNKAKTETVLQAPMMRTPTDYPIGAAAGFHYCKLLSPFRALEWIYIDSQFDHNGLASKTTIEENDTTNFLQ